MVRSTFHRVQAFVNGYRNRKAPILQLPPEILQEIVSYCDFSMAVSTKSKDSIVKRICFIDNIGRGGKVQLREPHMPAVYHSCRALRYISAVVLFEESSIQLLHSDIQQTLEWLSKQPHNALRGIVGLRIEVQRRRPVDYGVFAKVCQALACMPRLRVLIVGVPIEGNDNEYTVEPEPGLAKALRWHWKQAKIAFRKDYTTMRGYGWESHPDARWIRDLLLVNQGQLEKFTLGTMRRNKSLWIKTFLEKTMVEPLSVRQTYVKAMEKSKRDRAKSPSLAGLAEYVEKMQD